MISLKSPRVLLPVAGILAVVGFGVINTANAQTPPASPPATSKTARERHPELRKALKSLEKAKTDLQNGAHDFSGHREQALDLTNKAIEEVKLAMQSDKN